MKTNQTAVDLVIMRDSSTGNISSNPWSYTPILLSLPFIEVRIVNNSSLLLTCTPGEGCVTLRTPHLITALNLCNHRATPRARTTILRKQLRSGYILGLTLVRRVTLSALDLVALWTGPLRTEAAFPRGAQESTTVTIRALAHKSCLDFGLLTMTCA